MARTTSDCPRYRFFCFIFACLLYSLWRVVVLGIRFALDDDPDFTASPPDPSAEPPQANRADVLGFSGQAGRLLRPTDATA